MSVSLLSLITLIDKYCMLFSDAAVAARLVQLTFQVIYKKKCTKRFCLVYNSNECSTYSITTYLLLHTNSNMLFRYKRFELNEMFQQDASKLLYFPT